MSGGTSVREERGGFRRPPTPPPCNRCPTRTAPQRRAPPTAGATIRRRRPVVGHIHADPLGGRGGSLRQDPAAPASARPQARPVLRGAPFARRRVAQQHKDARRRPAGRGQRVRRRAPSSMTARTLGRAPPALRPLCLWQHAAPGGPLSLGVERGDGGADPLLLDRHPDRDCLRGRPQGQMCREHQMSELGVEGVRQRDGASTGRWRLVPVVPRVVLVQRDD